ncbi:uncharacterized protein LOC114828019 [Galendromus occidentalis]|uniref:DNA-directed RNA polymerase III subunit RPC3 n=1 Tax=Galendromus occidentalis TaxID=34638 RepID=A0AAJ7SCU8_9ACAR|nr:uncharacterized protein LOC114828019 [Galendromus occidentalis]
MTSRRVQIAEFILTDFYGPIVSAVAHQLLRNHSLTLPQLQQRVVQYPRGKIKESLMCLLQNGLVTAQIDRNQESRTQFRMSIDDVFSIIHCAGFIYRANLLFGEVGRELAHEFTLHGQLTAPEAVDIVKDRVDRPRPEVQKVINDMFETNFLITSPLFEKHLIHRDEKGSRALLASYNQTLTDGIMYSLNNRRFFEQERNEIITEIVGMLHCHPYTKNIIRCVIRVLETKKGGDEGKMLRTSASVHQDEIINMVEKKFRVSRNEILQCLKTLTFVPRNTQYRSQDDILILKKDPNQANCYILDWELAIRIWLRQTALRYASERHGHHASCILGMLLFHGPSEIEAIQKQTLICPKEAKCIVYTLENDNFLERVENITAGDTHRQEPRYRSTYLGLARLLENRWEQAIFNVLIQRKEIADTHRVLLNKYKTLDKFARTLDDSEEITHLWASLTRPERQTLHILRQQLLQTGVQQQSLCRELIMLKQASMTFTES